MSPSHAAGFVPLTASPNGVRATGSATFHYRPSVAGIMLDPPALPSVGGTRVIVETRGEVPSFGEMSCRFGLNIVPATVVSSV